MGEDAARGRIYLPVNELQRFDVKAHELIKRVAAPGTDPSDFHQCFRGLMQFQSARALTTYDHDISLLPAASL